MNDVESLMNERGKQRAWARFARGMGDVVLLGTLALAVTVLFVVSRSNSELRATVSRLSLDAYPRPGDYLPDVPAVVMGDEDMPISVLGAAQLPAVIYFFSPDCKYCADQREDLPRFQQEAAARGYSFVAVSTMWPKETGRMFPNRLSFPVVSESGGGIERSYRVVGTPIFISVNSSRQIEAVRVGKIDRERFAAEVLPNKVPTNSP
jgi:peroxiredoxin